MRQHLYCWLDLVANHPQETFGNVVRQIAQSLQT